VFFDSDATYGKSWGMADYLDYTDTPLIVAAVECDHGKVPGRLSEYSPFDFGDDHWGQVEGRGKITMDWFVNVFKPYIDKKYRTIPDREHTFIAGSSMGGLMSLYAVTEYNKYFSRAACLSPSVWAAHDKLETMIGKAELAPGTVVYMDYGSEELANHKAMLRLFNKMACHLSERGAMVNSRIVPGGQHCEASWERQIPIFMQTLFYGLE
jgi:predicted alpha/beta superfamily hydrolase